MRYAKNLSPDERRAVAILLKMDRRRHEMAIARIDQDLDRLWKLGVDIDDLPDWGEVEI